MPNLKKSISSRETNLAAAREESRGVLPGSPTWRDVLVTQYGEFGEQVDHTENAPITSDRQRRKPPLTQRRFGAGFTVTLTQENAPIIAEPALYADMRVKDEVEITDADGTGDEFTVDSGGDGYEAGDLLYVPSGPNAGLHVVTGTPTSTTIPVESSLEDESSVSHVGRRVGFEFDEGDAEIDSDGNLITTAKDLTELELVNGEHVSIGGDASASQFDTAGNNTQARADAVEANKLTFTKRESAAMEADDGTGKSIRIFFAPRVLKNETDPANIKELTNQYERKLGEPDKDSPGDAQYQYMLGCLNAQATVTVPASGLVTLQVQHQGSGMDLIDKDGSQKSGDRKPAFDEDPFNTADEALRAHIGRHGEDEPLADVVSNFSLTINNNVEPLDGVGAPAFGANVGMFNVSINTSFFFQTVEALEAIRNNDDLTQHIHLWQNNHGITIDVPALSGSGRPPTVNANQALVGELTSEAFGGAHVNEDLDHTLLLAWWDYLPDRAMEA